MTTYSAAGHTLVFGDDRTHVMGVINLSPESKNRDTYAAGVDEALAMADGYRAAGASIVDVGAQSSVIGNRELEPAEEVDRLAGVLAGLVDDGHIVSVDTWKPEVAGAALDLGAAIVNDTGGLRSSAMIEVVARHRAIAVVMYLEGESPLAVEALDVDPDKAARMAARLAERIDALGAAGVDQVISDPGIGITYTTDYDEVTRHQLRVVRRLGLLKDLGPPVLVPVPRKREPARVAAFATLALERGADVLRVHDVEAICDLVRLFDRAAP